MQQIQSEDGALMTRRCVPMFAAMAVTLSLLPSAPIGAKSEPNPVATNETSYQAFARVFPDPQGCLAYGKPVPPAGVSELAKGAVCADQFLSYEEVIAGAKFLGRRFPRFMEVLRLGQMLGYGRSAGIPRTVTVEGGKVQALGRDRRPLYLFKVTDKKSPIPEGDRLHFFYGLSIHGIERAGLEGGVRTMEDLVTWAACELDRFKTNTPACQMEGPFPKKIVETETKFPVPTAGSVLRRTVVYFGLVNPDGWARGQVAPTEARDGNLNANYTPGVFFQRYNGNGVDLNRDWPTIGYSFKPYSPGSEPETRAFATALRRIRKRTAAGRFAGGIDLHGMLTAYAFSYTLLGAGQRDYRKNALTVDTAIRAWEDQTKRLSWSPYVADRNADGEPDPDETCQSDPSASGARGHVPACVADQWGTVIDTIGYQVTGSLGDWIDSPIGLDAVGIDNEMYSSHLIPNTTFDPALEQTHIDGNKGLIYSQLSSLLTSGRVRFSPKGNAGYVYNPDRVIVPERSRRANRRLPKQETINVLLPCQSVEQDAPTGCDGGKFSYDGSSPTFEFTVKGPKHGYMNGGLYVTATRPNALGISDGNVGAIQLQHFDEGQWHPVITDFNQSLIYLQAGQVVTANDPVPGRWRVWFQTPAQVPSRLKIVFRRHSGEFSPGQTGIHASSMDFFSDLNRYTRKSKRLKRLFVERIIQRPRSLRSLDTLVVVNRLGSARYLRRKLGLSRPQVRTYFASLRRFVEAGGNLVLTDAALRALPRLGLGLRKRDVLGTRTLAPSFYFRVSEEVVSYEHPKRYPLARGVRKPGAAEQEIGRRQAVEPTPLGYTPDTFYDGDPQMPFFGVVPDAWRKACGKRACVTALSNPIGERQLVALGEARVGRGMVRVAGALLPDPVFQPDEANDHRFGLASYALTYTAYEVLENLINYRR